MGEIIIIGVIYCVLGMAIGLIIEDESESKAFIVNNYIKSSKIKLSKRVIVLLLLGPFSWVMIFGRLFIRWAMDVPDVKERNEK